MPLTKKRKQDIVESLKSKFEKQKSIIFLDYCGLKVKDTLNLRKKMKEQGCELKIAKKTLLGLILDGSGQGMKEKVKKLPGQIAIGFGYEDEVMPFKISGDFSKTNTNVKVLGGILSTKKDEFLSSEQAIVLSQLPSKKELLAKLVGSMKSPISGFVNVLGGNLKGLLRVLSQIKS